MYNLEEFLMKPKVDFAFKEIMYDEDALKGFLAAVLVLDVKEIKSVVIQNTDLRKIHSEDKQGILDVNVIMNDDLAGTVNLLSGKKVCRPN